MSKVNGSQNVISRKSFTPEHGLIKGQLVYIDPDGRPFVDFSGIAEGPIVALSAILLAEPQNEVFPIEVLLFIENGNALPIIVGVVRETICRGEKNIFKLNNNDHQRQVNLNVKALNIEATEGIALKCGDASVVLNKQGKVIVKGVEILSRSIRANKIKGATVQIN